MQGPQAALLGGGDQLHLQHGPIDLIIGADADGAGDRQRVFAAAHMRFGTILDGLVVDLPQHRCQLTRGTPPPADPVARRMYDAARPFCDQRFVTPMIAVAGSVADEVLAAMRVAVPLRRAYVNNGGDIAVFLAPGMDYTVAVARADGADLGRIRFNAADGIGGIATSGAEGRSQSRGIADSVSVLAKSAALADVAATLIANAVDLADHPGITRQPANQLHPDSDLGARAVVTGVPVLTGREKQTALGAGLRVARGFLGADQIKGAALFLQGHSVTIGQGFDGQGAANQRFGPQQQALENENV